MDLFENIWFKRTISVICSLYGVLLAFLAYMSIFYKIEYTNKQIFAFVYVAITLTFLAIMILARKQYFTSVLSIVFLALMLPIVFLNLGDWLLIIPPAVLVITMFFVCRANETVKTVFGTIFLLVYIISGLAYFVVTNFFMTTSSDTYRRLSEGASNSGQYRYYVVDVKDNSGGRTEVYVEPNNKDKDLGFVKFKVKGYAQKKYNVRNHDMPTIEWREGDILYINNERCDIKPWKWQFTLN